MSDLIVETSEPNESMFGSRGVSETMEDDFRPDSPSPLPKGASSQQELLPASSSTVIGSQPLNKGKGKEKESLAPIAQIEDSGADGDMGMDMNMDGDGGMEQDMDMGYGDDVGDSDPNPTDVEDQGDWPTLCLLCFLSYNLQGFTHKQERRILLQVKKRNQDHSIPKPQCLHHLLVSHNSQNSLLEVPFMGSSSTRRRHCWQIRLWTGLHRQTSWPRNR